MCATSFVNADSRAGTGSVGTLKSAESRHLNFGTCQCRISAQCSHPLRSTYLCVALCFLHPPNYFRIFIYAYPPSRCVRKAKSGKIIVEWWQYSKPA
jgi:hypothetical protein